MICYIFIKRSGANFTLTKFTLFESRIYKECLLLVFLATFLPLGGVLFVCFDLERLSADAQIEK